jgi:hypothetical protein
LGTGLLVGIAAAARSTGISLARAVDLGEERAGNGLGRACAGLRQKDACGNHDYGGQRIKSHRILQITSPSQC